MDRRVIEAKLERLRRCVQRIEQKRPSTLEALTTDYDLQDILSVNLERAVQLCVDIAAHVIADREMNAPTSMAATFEALRALQILSPDLTDRMKKSATSQPILSPCPRSDWLKLFETLRGFDQPGSLAQMVALTRPRAQSC